VNQLPLVRRSFFCVFGFVGLVTGISPAFAAAPALLIGAAKVDVTPAFPVRLSGYAARNAESEGVETHLFARALAIGGSAEEMAVVVTVDATGIPSALTDDVARRVKEKSGIPRERFVLACTHTHTAPCLNGLLPNLFGQTIPADHQEHIDRYTKWLGDRLVEVALAAVGDKKPGTLSLTRGKATFAANRRRQGGPVDHDLPLLVARDADGTVRAILLNYACHCTTLGPELNKTCSDWAGYAAEQIEQEHPGAIALVTIGCGADSNPKPRTGIAFAQQHGREIATEVKRLLTANEMRPVRSGPIGRFKQIELAYDKLPTREEWEKLSQRPDAIGYNARTQLGRLKAGEPIPTALPYAVQTLTFGDDLAMVFLAGEVVLDYALRLKGDFDPARLWVTAYANDVPCYIPSRRILSEGGYEAEGAMVYYGRPGKLAPSVENDIVRAVHELLPTGYRTQQSLNEFPLPKTVDEAIKSFKLRDDLMIEAVAAEPLIVDPVAIDWDARGRLWILEMHDYPSGLHENWTPGGRVKVLEDTDGDGIYDKATLFLDGLPFPQGIMCWRKGVIVCAAPNILYAEDTDGDGNAMGKADLRRVLFSGFSPDNQQWEVNGLAWGLDNWVYGASSIRNDPIHVGGKPEPRHVELGGRDFRMNPDTLAFEPASGRTQFCRVRDDWDNWFGNDNSNPLWHYPLPERYLARNPHVPAPSPRVYVAAGGAEATRLFPASRTLERFNQPASANRVTSGCGPGIYRDRLLGDEFYGNAFFCEPVHNLVQRLVLEPNGVTFSGHRAKENAASEFLASTDNWFRPVQVRTGPDGALWVVDMYRFVIEHPRWITPDRLARLDTRGGADKGRIYRIYPKGLKPRKIESLAALDDATLAARLDNPNGTLRDIIHRELFQRAGVAAVPVLIRMAVDAKDPAVRVQAICTLDGIAQLPIELLQRGLADPDPNVRRHALRLSERHFATNPELTAVAMKLADDPNAGVRYQLALSLGEWDDGRLAPVLARLAASAPEDPWMRAAVLSSSVKRPAEILAAVTGAMPEGKPRTDMIRGLAVTLAATAADAGRAAEAVIAVTPADDAPVQASHLSALAAVLDAGKNRGRDWIAPLLASSRPATATNPAIESRLRLAAARAERAFTAARKLAVDPRAAATTRVVAIGLLGCGMAATSDDRNADLDVLAGLLRLEVAPAVQAAAIGAIARSPAPQSAQQLLAAWPRVSPSVRPQVIEALIARKAWIDPLLSAIETRKVGNAEISTAQRDRLLRLDDPAIRARAEKALLAVKPESRAKAVAQAKPALALNGNAAAGAVLFTRLCAACHQVNGEGNAVGPNLAALTDRSGPALLTAIVDPNAAVEGRFAAYEVELRDGRSLSGLVVDETAAGLTVVQGGGVRETVARTAVEKVRNTGLSLMPEGLEAGLQPQELADLIAYVQKAETRSSR
jgi:putative membrane-bound dehydrogenase-like protein